MSYILDALKKADAERNAHVAPSIYMPQTYANVAAAAVPAWHRPAWWLSGAAVVAIIAALGGATWFLWPHNEPVKLVKPAHVPAATAPVAPAMPPAPAPVTVHARAPSRTESTVTTTTSKETSKAAPVPKTATKKKVEKVTSPEKPAAPAPAVSDSSLPGMHELPDSLRQQIPSLTIGGYIYSGNKADRSVLINNRLRHEGEEIAPGLTLEKMMPNGMVLSFRGTRFRSSY